MTSEQHQFHIFFFPFFAPGHMIPGMDMASLFASRGIKSTIVTTPANEHYFSKIIETDTQKPGLQIDVVTLDFPTEEVGLPRGCENFDSVTSTEMFYRFFKAVDLLQHPFANLMDKYHPSCLVADPFFHWANSIASNFGIPCLAFHGSNYFSRCIVSNLLRYEPHKKVSSDSEAFVVPGDLPHEVRLTVSELAPYDKKEGPNFLLELMDKIRIGMKRFHGVIMNSFYELESGYVDYYEKVLGMKQWHIGPLSLYSHGRESNGAHHRGKSFSIDVNDCRSWLDEKEPLSVIYVCFGSVSNVSDAQLHEIAIALENLGQNFILVVRKEDTEEWLPHSFEARMKSRGLIIRGWAPQQMILNHRSIGGFVSHCGWNSILEGVTMGVPMVTWPLHAEQFYNEKLVTDILKIGIQVGAKEWVPRVGNHNIIIGSNKILKAMKSLMYGEEAQDMRNRVKELKVMAKKAIHEGGSSFCHLNALIGELKSYKN